MRETGMNDKPQVIRDTDDDARRQARILLRGARFAAIGVIDPETGFPFVSRVLLGMDTDGAAVILVSNLSAHTTALLADPRASLLTGEPGKGDPLAHPRLTLQCTAESVDRESDIHQRLRTRFLARHPKSQLYIDFPDFRFFRLRPERASLNGGFGRAYHLSSADFLVPEINHDLFENEAQLLLELGAIPTSPPESPPRFTGRQRANGGYPP
jgi:putative heme iron utilization protein